MTLLFDLGHPAHLHLFKHTIVALKDKGHKVIITAKDQPVLIALLHDAGLDFINLGRKGSSLPAKALKQLVFDWKVWRIARKHHVDMGLGVSMSVPHAALFCKMKSVLFDDDDRAVTPLFYRFAHSVADRVLSPSCLAFQQGGAKYTYYEGYHELAYLHHRAGWTDLSEHLAMRPADGFPLRDVGHENARAHNISQRRPGALQRRRDVVEDLSGLRIGIADADDLAVGVCRSGAGQIDVVADAHRARIADNGLPRCARCKIMTGQGCAPSSSFTKKMHPANVPSGSRA